MGFLEERRKMSYSDKAKETENPAAKRLFTLMEEKKTNLTLANDDLVFENFLPIIEKTGEEIAIVKTHMDILRYPTFDEVWPLIEQLQKLSEKYGFMIFEDRKFADIGKIVKEQYTGGPFKIASWAHLVNAHAISGPGIIDGLYESAKPYIDKGEDRGLIMLAHMTPEGNLFTEEYAEKTIKMAGKHKDKETEKNPHFVIGYVAGGSDPDKVRDWVAAKAEPWSLIATPGVNFDPSEARLGQRYAGPEEVMNSGSDSPIVGSGIYNQADPAAAAKKYREIAWNAYKSIRI